MGVSVATDDRGGRIRDQRLFFFAFVRNFPTAVKFLLLFIFFFPEELKDWKAAENSWVVSPWPQTGADHPCPAAIYFYFFVQKSNNRAAIRQNEAARNKTKCATRFNIWVWRHLSLLLISGSSCRCNWPKLNVNSLSVCVHFPNMSTALFEFQ